MNRPTSPLPPTRRWIATPVGAFILRIGLHGVAALALGAPALHAGGESSDSAIEATQGVTPGELAGDSARWYAFTAPPAAALSDYAIHAHDPQTTFTATLALHDACGAPPFAVDGGVAPDRNAFLRAPLAPGMTYYVRVGSAAGGDGAFRLAILAAGQGGMCGDTGTGGCFLENGSPFCDDTCGGPPCSGCCAAICAADPFCCDVEWDEKCVGEAMLTCDVVPVDLQLFEVER
jgi:hypothetical protein